MNIWPTAAELPTPEDFESEANLPSGRVPGLYLLWDGDELVYVGQSGDIRVRISQHRKEGTKHFSHYEWYQIYDLSARVKWESILILFATPKYNRGLSLGLRPGFVWEIRWGRGSARSTRRTRKPSAKKRK